MTARKSDHHVKPGRRPRASPKEGATFDTELQRYVMPGECSVTGWGCKWLNIAHFVAETIGQKSTPRKCTVLSAVQIDFFRRLYQRSQRKQRRKKNLHLLYRTAIQTATQMENNETLPLSQKRPKRKAGGSFGNRTDKGNFFLVGQRKGNLWQIMTSQTLRRRTPLQADGACSRRPIRIGPC